MTPKIEKFLSQDAIRRPCLVVDVDVIEENYRSLRRALPAATIYYAVKANPGQPVVERLVELGSSFDAASFHEVEDCLAVGASADRICYGNTIKKQTDIAAAFAKGVRLFAFDCIEELEKLAQAAPGASVYCRIMVENGGAEWPLSKKFGCQPSVAADLLRQAVTLGLDAHGVSFHVGSQQGNPERWEAAIAQVAMVFADLRDSGIDLKSVNLGGGFPVRYRSDIPELDTFADAIMAAMTENFGNRLPSMVVEPGRVIAATAGVMESEVVLVSRRNPDDAVRWVYLDVGLFGGLAETMDEAIRYSIEPVGRSGEDGPVAIAGPTCDGADVMYEKADYRMPLSLRAGDRVRIHAAGAYTTPYAAVKFNGFAPMDEHFI